MPADLAERLDSHAATAREDHCPLGPEELQVVGDGEAGAIDHADGGEARRQRGERGCPEGSPERLAPLEERFGGSLDQGEERLGALQRLV